ncbi:MAG TPA: response regulator transcription factor [Acidimicrobiales bacterium]|nr:response regulator transcription factor [Acidimicrobiales bacterium]
MTSGFEPAAAVGDQHIRLAIAEDHAVVADALATMLGFADHIEIVGVVASGSAIVDLDAALLPDVTLMDVTLQGINGIEATRAIVAARPEARVLVLTMHDDADTVTSAMAAGAVGFLPKNATRSELVTAIGAVARGEGYLHSSVTRTFLDRVGPLADRSLSAERLTDREHQVLEHLVEGASTREIAEALIVSEETVKSHLTHIYQKLQARDRVHAVALALRRGLVQ